MYEYKKMRPEIFEEKNQALFLAVRKQTHDLLDEAGAVTMSKAASLPEGAGAADLWLMMACVERLVELVELEEIEELSLSEPPWDMHSKQVFVKGKAFPK